VNALDPDAAAALSVLMTLPIVVVWVFALYDIVQRRDLPAIRKVAYAAIVVLVLPATLLYLLSRPTSIVRHHDRSTDDWREGLVERLDARPGGPPVLGRRQEELLVERVRQLQAPKDGATGSR
jgi:hypothetical protein